MQSSTYLSLQRDRLAQRHPVELRGVGLSMVPHLLPGCRVTLEGIAPGELRPGDMVALDNGRRWVVHRLLAVEGDRLHTKGDAAGSADGPRPLSQLVGRVRSARLGPLRWPAAGLSRLFLVLFGRTDPPLCRTLARALGAAVRYAGSH
jgi:hypothetical protein